MAGLGCGLLATIAVVGCHTYPPIVQPIPSPHHPALSEAAAASPPPSMRAPRPRPLTPNRPAPWSNTWIGLDEWVALNGLPRAVTARDGDGAVFEVRASSGVLTLTANHQVVQFQGAACWLSYAPQIKGGQLRLHALDARKTLQPLVQSPTPPPLAGRTIVLDPGHGGKDTGTLSVVGAGQEKTFTLDWARRLGRLLASQGWRVVLTRTNDVAITLADRVALADRVGADLFVSLHFNGGGANGGLSGIETYCLTPIGLPSNLVRDGADDPQAQWPNNGHDEANLLWAFQLHRHLVTATGAVDRGVRRARFLGVLRGQQRPAVLLEAGYLSNPAEARNIASPDYRQRLAEAVATAMATAPKRDS